jgi:hypothetical protein
VRVLNYMMEYIYDPLLNSDKSQDWGESDVDSKKEFLSLSEKFKKEVTEALKLMEPGKEHFKINSEELSKYMTLSESERIQKF